MKTIVLAGGYATRLYPITADRAKPLLPVAGKPIIDYVLATYPFSDRPIVSTNRRFAPQFMAWHKQSGRDVEIVVEETSAEMEKLGTVGAIGFLIRTLGLDEDLLVIGGDNIFEFSIESFLAAYRERPLIALYDLKDLDRVRGRYGAAIVEGKQIIDFQEKPQYPTSTLVSTACYVYPQQTLPLIGEFLRKAGPGKDAPGYFNAWLLKEAGRAIDAFTFDTGWYDIGDRASYIEANQHYAKRDTVTGENVAIECSTVRDSVIFDDVVIEDSSIVGCVIDQGCSLSGVALEDCLVGAGTVIRRT